LLENEAKPNLTEEEAADLEKELRGKYGRRKLGTNVDRYKEEEVKLDSDGNIVILMNLHISYRCTGEPIVEPEVDLSSFLEKQRISDDVGLASHLPEEQEEDNDDISVYLNSLKNPTLPLSKKGKVQQIEWDEGLEALNQEKKVAEAARGPLTNSFI
jgi:hypothetical protein